MRMRTAKTHILKILVYRKLLRDRLDFLLKEDVGEAESFLRSVYRNEIPEMNSNLEKHLPLLLRYGYISPQESNKYTRSSLLGVKAINFELTYRCTANCRHCLQKNIRSKSKIELATEKVKEAILQAYLAGLCACGINFTGGEVLGNREDLFEILSFAQSLDIPFRLNTNSWWSRKKRLKIGSLTFRSALELVEHIKSLGLNQLALSYDVRLEDAHQTSNLVEAIKVCETARVFYQLIFTGINPAEINGHISKLQKKIGRKLIYLIPVSAEMVDIGGASDLNQTACDWQSNRCTCENKGFYHPFVLHVSPEGKVRTCMYALGLSNAGDLTQSSLADIINGFPEVRNNETFACRDEYRDELEKLVAPYFSLYRPLVHGCTRNVILARVLEMAGNNHVPNLLAIHRQIASELNLAPVSGR